MSAERTYRVTFERVGRGNCVGRVEEFVAHDADGLAEQIFNFIRKGKFLMSKFFEVTVNLETETGSIDGGRFGTFTIEPTIKAVK